MTPQPAPIASLTTSLRHVVRLIHASTGVPISGLAAWLDPPIPGWRVQIRPDAVVVAARPDIEDPPPSPRLAVTLTDAVTARLLDIPPVAGMPPRTVVVPLSTERIDFVLHAVPMTLTLVLSTPSTGVPRTGASVAARATRGPTPRPTIPLPESTPGTYRSAGVEWTAGFTPLDLLVGGQPLRTLVMDFTQAGTRIHLVDTT